MSNASSKLARPTGPVSPNTVPWSPWLALLLVIVLFYGSQLFGGLLVSTYPLTQGWSDAQITAWLDKSIWAQFSYILLAEAFTLGLLYLFLRAYKSGFARLGLRRPRWRDLGYALAAAPVYFVCFVLAVAAVTALVPGLDIEQEQAIGFEGVHGLIPLIVVFLSLVLLPAITEEILARGFLYSSLKKALPLIGAVLTTSLLFAAAHLMGGKPGEPLLYIAAVDTFVLSLVLIYLREKTGSLWAPITLHALKNSVAYFILFIAPLLHLTWPN